MKICAITLTKNEEDRIEDCLKHIRPYVDYILVIDGESEDKTVEITKKYADKVIVKPFSGSYAEERNCAHTLVPKDCDWLLHVDADERFDIGFLKKMKKVIQEVGELDQPLSICVRLPRVNLPDGKDYPDHQVRFFKNSKDIEWRGNVHEVPYLKSWNTPLDQTNNPKYGEKKFTVLLGDDYPIIHLPRREDEKRSWW